MDAPIVSAVGASFKMIIEQTGACTWIGRI